MFVSRSLRRRRSSTDVPQVGVFGILGAGNLGNDASMESILDYLRQAHPGAAVDALCSGPTRLIEHYGVPATDFNWRASSNRAAIALPLRAFARAGQAFAIAAWVRRHDVVIVPGAGVLEASLPTRPWQISYALFLLSGWGRVFGTKVALVSVGASTINDSVTRWLSNGSARLAYYRSYRDSMSCDAMRKRGLDTSHDHVYADLVFGVPTSPEEPGDPSHVAVGVMSYYGSNDDRPRAAELHQRYVDGMKQLLHRLVQDGRRVTLVGGDSVNDAAILEELVSDVHAREPDLDPIAVVAERTTTLQELMQAIRPASAVIAIRFHNLIAALKLGKPTISIGYSEKHDVLMADMGLSEFCQEANSLDVDRLMEQFIELEERASELRQKIEARTAEYRALVRDQFDELSEVLFSTTQATFTRPQTKSGTLHKSVPDQYASCAARTT